MPWISESPTARELGTRAGNLLGGIPLLSYQRYNLSLRPEDVLRVKPGLDDETLESLQKMDVPENLETLSELGALAAAEQVKPEHFPTPFDLPG